jgi:hypothetical protein
MTTNMSRDAKRWLVTATRGKLLLAIWLSCRAAYGFEVSVSLAAVRAPTRVSNEVWATLRVPLDEWLTPTPALTKLARANPLLTEAWNAAESNAERSRDNDLRVGANLGQSPSAEPKVAPPVVSNEPSIEQRPILAVWVPRVDSNFLRGLMSACSVEFRTSHLELQDLASRARNSAWLPELQVKGGRNTDETLRLTPTEAEPDRYQLVGGAGVRFEGQIKWSFNQLVFARDELAVARLQGALETEKRKRQHHAMDVLGKWLHAWVVLGDRSQTPGLRLKAWIDERASRAELDWVSQGWFSRHVKPSPEVSALGLEESLAGDEEG